MYNSLAKCMNEWMIKLAWKSKQNEEEEENEQVQSAVGARPIGPAKSQECFVECRRRRSPTWL